LSHEKAEFQTFAFVRASQDAKKMDAGNAFQESLDSHWPSEKAQRFNSRFAGISLRLKERGSLLSVQVVA
jgi:hypothetical protein